MASGETGNHLVHARGLVEVVFNTQRETVIIQSNNKTIKYDCYDRQQITVCTGLQMVVNIVLDKEESIHHATLRIVQGVRFHFVNFNVKVLMVKNIISTMSPIMSSGQQSTTVRLTVVAALQFN